MVSSNNWSRKELRAAVMAYADMHSKEADGISFVKKHYYSDLADRLGRSENSIEYRMQNISHVYSLMGRNWVSGLKPAKNVGPNVAAMIEQLISEVEGLEFPRIAEFETEVNKFKSQKVLEKPTGITKPEKTYSSITSYTRDPKVKAWVLKEASGKCECCGQAAPFTIEKGEPFLEVHHLRRLADGGSDTIANVVALCPNCHREMHYGVNRVEVVKSMYSKVNRLLPE